MSFEIANKVALVTGANRGIGKSIAETFLKHGAKKVYLAVRDLNSAQALVSEYGDRVQALKVDYLKADTIHDLATEASDVEVVVNNAGILEVSDPLHSDAEEFLKRQFEVNTFGLLRIAQAFAPVLKRNGGGALVQLNSVASIKNFTEFSTYCASKSAAYSLTQGLRNALSRQNTAVLSVHPGPIRTDMGDKAGFTDVADSVSVVAEGIVKALGAGEFHLFPDALAKQVEAAYQSFADAVIQPDEAVVTQ